jgi:UDP-N-acetylmuramate dehydrogenase
MTEKIIDFSKFTSIKIGQPEKIFLIEHEDEVFDFDSKNSFILGSGNNILVSDNISQKIIKLSKKFDFINLENNILTIGGATPSGKIVSFAKKHNFSGFEFMSKLPGTLGGMLKMNAGLKEYEIFNNLIEIKTVTDFFNKQINYISKNKIKHGYRFTEINNLVFEAKFKIDLDKKFDFELIELFKNMRKNQPKYPSAGSCFKNPKNQSDKSAGYLLEQVGLRGFKIGNMGFAEEHSNFLVNYGNGNYQEARELINLAESRVKEKFNINLEREIIIL